MPETDADIINEIRRASRNLIRELGLLNRTLAGTELSASFVHALVDIGDAGTLTAKNLSDKLLLDKSTVSRMVKKLISRGDLIETPSPTDNRQKNLQLTKQGQITLEEISEYAKVQVRNAISPLTNTTRQEVLNGLRVYSEALGQSRLSSQVGKSDEPSGTCKIVEGYSAGLAGCIIKMHATYYRDFAGFDEVFEATVAKGLSEFIPRLKNSKNLICYAEKDNKIGGSIAIDGEDLGGNIAHLRWFIVEKEMHGSGIGKALFSRAINFCDTQDFSEIHLWTFKGLDAARSLYENSGFVLTDEYSGDQWGKQVQEQKFIRQTPSKT